jgi:hypothetical protein
MNLFPSIVRYRTDQQPGAPPKTIREVKRKRR